MYAYIWDLRAVTLLSIHSLQQAWPFLHESRAHFILMYKAWAQAQKRTDTTQQDLWVDSLQQNDSGIRKETYFSSVLCVGFEKQRENLLGQIMLNNSEQGPALSQEMG